MNRVKINNKSISNIKNILAGSATNNDKIINLKIKQNNTIQDVRDTLSNKITEKGGNYQDVTHSIKSNSTKVNSDPALHYNKCLSNQQDQDSFLRLGTINNSVASHQQDFIKSTGALGGKFI